MVGWRLTYGSEGDGRGDGCELLLPVAELLFHSTGLELLALPGNIVGVEYGREGESGLRAAAVLLVESGHLIDDQRERPAVADDVVSDDDEEVMARGEGDENGLEQRRVGEIELVASEQGESLLCEGGSLGGWQVTKVNEGKLEQP